MSETESTIKAIHHSFVHSIVPMDSILTYHCAKGRPAQRKGVSKRRTGRLEFFPSNTDTLAVHPTRRNDKGSKEDGQSKKDNTGHQEEKEKVDAEHPV